MYSVRQDKTICERITNAADRTSPSMELKQHQIDAFSSRVFEANPAAVCPLSAWCGDALLQAIAEENNLSETAFFVQAANGVSGTVYSILTSSGQLG